MPDNTQNKPTKEDVERVDEYHGKYKQESDSASAEQKFGESENPVRNTPLPAKGLRSVGGG